MLTNLGGGAVTRLKQRGCEACAQKNWAPLVFRGDLHAEVSIEPRVVVSVDLEGGASAPVADAGANASSFAPAAALQAATFESKSIAIGLALLGLHIDAEGAEAAARVEETANIERWGLVEGAHDYDLARVRVQLASAAFFTDATTTS